MMYTTAGLLGSVHALVGNREEIVEDVCLGMAGTRADAHTHREGAIA